MTVLAAERCRMHRHSEDVVAAVVLAAIAELRFQRTHQGAVPGTGSGTYQSLGGIPAAVAMTAEAVRDIRAGVMPRARYEAARGPGDPDYGDLPADRRDEDQLLWLITQALTGN